ncbi:recombination regulator RecX [Moraxella nasibovis]|uniref:regulatory protein RecX n=1 Tax=Moraxella nasibovis TaxID=2904120 RepID=UPI00240ED6C2|nr:regulatory protein RecX [Moraxella nasibovis]WFF38123.1 recombination regulator RecX [Moraxella nasibovis]
MTHIKTLAEILADMGEPVSADSSWSNSPSNQPTQSQTNQPNQTQKTPKSQKNQQSDKKHLPKKGTQTKPKPSSIGTLLGTSTHILDERTAVALQNVAIEPIYQNDKAINYMRWLAFYYLSNRELSQKQLRQKLLDKECDPQMVDELITEFAQKNYQSDERCAFMLIREGVRRGRGKHHIAQSLKTAGINLPYSLDELIQMADITSLSDGTILADDDDKPEHINWLKLAVEARCKKYGNHLPTDQKQKARQLRFLQYRGFEMSVCFDALKYTLDDMDELDFV